mgnify:CR=1 FL=1|jgi:hypothetical protein
MTPKDRAQKIYTKIYMSLSNELSHKENSMTAKDICKYMCIQVLDYLEFYTKEPFETSTFWFEVRNIIDESSHKKLYKPIKY